MAQIILGACPSIRRGRVPSVAWADAKVTNPQAEAVPASAVKSEITIVSADVESTH
jgi:hypothetical protein